MNIEEIKSYEEISNYCETIGYEYLTDEKIDILCEKIGEIRDRRIAEHKKMNYPPKIYSALKLIEYNIATSRAYQLTHCTSKREFAIALEIEKEIETANYKEACAREYSADKVLRKK